MNQTVHRTTVYAALVAALNIGLIASERALAQAPPPGCKPPTTQTMEVLNQQRATLPLADKRDFEEAHKGFIAAPPYRQIMQEKGGVAWDIDRWKFLLDGKDFDSIHPSLQRQATLNMEYGLFEVIPGVYQVRGFDLANISFVKGDTGWIVIDPCTVKETAKAALDFVNQTLGQRPVVAVIVSHSHGDHFGGIRGVLDEADWKAGKVPLFAPKGFLEEAISENLFAGNAMTRRKTYTYGDLLPPGPFGHVDCSIGKNSAVGSVGILPPTREIEKPYETVTVDGVEIEFQFTPGTEAPTEMNAWFPKLKAFFGAENCVATLHNLYTLRGAKVRDAMVWSKYLNESLYRYGDQAEVLFTAHCWPRWGKDRIRQILRDQRDMYANLNNQVLHLANQGVTINEIHNVYKPPASLQKEWTTHGYHGSYEHNSRAVINRYLGYWDANPATLVPLSPQDSAPLYVEMMGGAAKILAKGKELFEQGKYRYAQEILNKLVYAEPTNQNAKNLLADCFEQLGYQAESPSLRNCYLSAAKELRDGVQDVERLKGAPADIVRGTSTQLLLDYLAILVDSRKAEGLAFKINLATPDNGEQFIIEMSNATLTSIKGYQAKDADLSIMLNRSDLEEIMIGHTRLAELAQSGKAKVEGDQGVLQKLSLTLDKFDPLFEMMPGTRREKPAPAKVDEVFQHDAPAVKAP